jgi:hypothetical protein
MVGNVSRRFPLKSQLLYRLSYALADGGFGP